MANVSRTISYDAFLTLTAQKLYKSGVVTDQILDAYVTFAYLKAKGRVEKMDGGESIGVNVMTGRSPNFGPYHTYDTLDTAPADGMTKGHYFWSSYNDSLVISGEEKDMNRGAAKIKSLLKNKYKQLVGTCSEGMNKELWDLATYETTANTSANSGKSIWSIPYLINVGNDPNPATIDAGVNSYWRPQRKDSAALNYETLMKEIRHEINNCSHGATGDAPDFAIGDQYTWENVVDHLDTKVRYMQTDKAKAGFENIRLSRACEFFYDVHVPDPSAAVNYDSASWVDGAIYYMNSEWLKLCILAGKDFAPGKFIEPANQDGFVSKHIFRGQMVTDQRRKLGVHYDISPTITSA